MRELKECTAEVFRRSEKRIKERKRARRRMLVCAIPLCFCIAVWSAARVPTMTVKVESIPPEQSTPVTEAQDKSIANKSPANDGTTPSDTQMGSQSWLDPDDDPGADKLIISGCFGSGMASDAQPGGQSAGGSSYADIPEADTNEVLSILNHFFDLGISNVSSVEIDREDETDTIGASADHRIIITTEDGVKTTYLLSADQLTDTSTGQTLILTEDQLTQLKLAMGISK